MATHSITRAADWRRVRIEGRTGRAGDLRVLVAPRPKSGMPSRLGLRVHVDGRARAVRRNKARRRLRAAWELAAPENGVDVVIHADGSYADKNFQDVTNEVSLALERSGVAGGLT